MRAWVAMCLMLATAPIPAPDAPSLDAQLARSTAVESARAGRWADALKSADEAVRLAPRWADAYFVRAGIHHGIAGKASETAPLKTFDAEVDYAAIGASLRACAADLEQYLRVVGSATDAPAVVQQIGVIRTRIQMAEAHRERRVGYARTAAGTLSCTSGRVRASDDIHCCWPGETWNGSACEGTARCPSGTEPRPDLGAPCFPVMLFTGDDKTKGWSKLCKAAGLPRKSVMLFTTDWSWLPVNQYVEPGGQIWRLDVRPPSGTFGDWRDNQYTTYHALFYPRFHKYEDDSHYCPAVDGWILTRATAEAKSCKYLGYLPGASGVEFSAWCCP